MSALGHKRTSANVRAMSALLPKADMVWRGRDVRFVPKADIAQAWVYLCAGQAIDRGRPANRSS